MACLLSCPLPVCSVAVLFLSCCNLCQDENTLAVVKDQVAVGEGLVAVGIGLVAVGVGGGWLS